MDKKNGRDRQQLLHERELAVTGGAVDGEKRPRLPAAAGPTLEELGREEARGGAAGAPGAPARGASDEAEGCKAAGAGESSTRIIGGGLLRGRGGSAEAARPEATPAKEGAACTDEQGTAGEGVR